MGIMSLNMKDNPRFKNKEARNMLSFILALDPHPTLKLMVQRMFRMGAHNIRFDTMLVRRDDGKVEELPDPTCFLARVNDHVGVMLLRSRDGEWWLNGY